MRGPGFRGKSERGFLTVTPSPTGINRYDRYLSENTKADGKTLSPLAGQVVVSNLMPGRYGVVATPGGRPDYQRRRVAADQHP